MAPVSTSASPMFCLRCILLFLWCNQLIALAMNVDNLNLRIILKMLAQFGDINIHRAGIKVIVVYPDGLQCEVALKNLVGMTAKQGQQLILLCCQFRLIITYDQQLLLCVKSKFADMIKC